VLMNNADRVKIACLAQLVNAIGAIRTEPGGTAWRQTIFHPFALAARHARGMVLRPVIDSPARPGKLRPDLPYLVASATWDEDRGELAVFALNRHLDEEQELTLDLRGFGTTLECAQALELHHDDLQAVNTQASPDAFVPRANARVRVEGAQVKAQLRAASWNVLTLRRAR